jgi:hypothetical protein
MNYAVFDCETTGVTQKDEVVQFSALLLDDEMKLQKVYNCFCYTQVPFNHEASTITGLTAEKVHELSGGKFFEDFYCASDLFQIPDLVWCGWNGVFDKNAINNTLTHNGLDAHDFGQEIRRLGKTSGVYYFDVMKLYSSLNGIDYYEKLSACVRKMKYSQGKLDSMYQKLLRISGMDSSIKFHNALYDSMITWLYLAANRKRCY